MNFLDRHKILFACDWTEERLDRIKTLRKLYANREQSPTITKAGRKECIRWTKACTVLLEFFYATGRFAKTIPRDAFPIELEWHLTWVLWFLDGDMELCDWLVGGEHYKTE